MMNDQTNDEQWTMNDEQEQAMNKQWWTNDDEQTVNERRYMNKRWMNKQ